LARVICAVAAEHKIKIVALTDSALSPIARLADISVIIST
jgi:DNA-binding MurR/RpiR family transcriptional regulator